MRVLVNGQPFQTPSTRGRGIGRYARTLFDGMARARPDWDFEVLEFDRFDPIGPDEVPARSRRRTYACPRSFEPFSPVSRWQAESQLTEWIDADQPDMYLNISLFEGETIQPHSLRGDVRHVAVTHDLIPVIYAPVVFQSAVWAMTYSEKLAILRDADLVLANSEASATDFRHLFPGGHGRTVNIAGATESTFTAEGDPDADERLLSTRGVERPFFFVGGGDCWRKNMRGCVAGFARLPRDIRDRYDLVIAGHYSEHENLRIESLASDLGVAYQVRQLGRVSDDELAALYRRCRAFLFPSLYEGLGLPVVEALRCGSPVVTADTSSLPEYAGPASHYCNPLDVESIAEAMAAAEREPYALRREERIAYGYKHTPETVGETACVAIERILSIPRIPPRPRLAVFAKLQPPHGIEPAYLELLAKLSQHYAIEIVCQPNLKPLLLALRMQYPLIPIDLLPERMQVVNYRRAIYFESDHDAWQPRRELPGPVLRIGQLPTIRSVLGLLEERIESVRAAA